MARLLKDLDFEDHGVFELMLGTSLVGTPSKSPLYADKSVPAQTTRDLLIKSAAWRNQSLIGKVPHQDEPHLRQTLWDETMKEKEKGFVKGPFESLDEVRASLGIDHDVVVTRRFVLLQGSGPTPKPRVIDDAKESMINSAYSVLEMLSLHDLDFNAALALTLGGLLYPKGPMTVELQNGQVLEGMIHPSLVGDLSVWGRCLDLSKAYKQVPIASDSLGLAVLLVRDPVTSKPRFFTTQSMPFGRTASVYSFNRITRSLLHLMRHGLRLWGGVFYDDFALFEMKQMAANASRAVSLLLDALGWRFARDEDKGREFESSFNLLGARLDLSKLHLGDLTVSNKPERISFLVSRLEAVADKGSITRSEAMSIHGVLNYATGFFVGHGLRMSAWAFAKLSTNPVSLRPQDLSLLCRYTCKRLKSLKPCVWSRPSMSASVIVFTDGAFEDGRATWGAVVLDPLTGAAFVYHGVVPKSLLNSWLEGSDHKQCVSQVESYATLLVRYAFVETLRSRCAIFFIDNEAARFSLIKGSSPSPSMLRLTAAFHALGEDSPCAIWLERVPSPSNIADLPSRGQHREAAEMLGAECVGDISLPLPVARSLIDDPSLPSNLYA